MNAHRNWALSLFLALAACSLVPQAQTPEEKLGVAFATITATADTTANRLVAGRLSPDQAQEIQGILEHGYQLAMTAKVALAAGRPTDALSTLAIVTGLLDQLEVRLEP
jgi:hypothetical protein